MSDDAIYRGTVDPLGSLRRRFERSRGWGRVGASAGLAGLGIVELLGGGLLGLGPVIAGFGMAVVELHGRRVRRGSVDLHDAGLRISGTDATVRWDEVAEVRAGYTIDQRARDRTSGVTLERADGARFELPVELRGIDELRAAIESATTSALRARAEAGLDGGVPLRFGAHRFDGAGLHTTRREVPWSALGPARQQRGCVILESALGPFEVAIGAVANPAVVTAIVAARGRRAA